MAHIFFQRLERRRSTQALIASNIAQAIIPGCLAYDPSGMRFDPYTQINPAAVTQQANFSFQQMPTFAMQSPAMVIGDSGMPRQIWGMPMQMQTYGMPLSTQPAFNMPSLSMANAGFTATQVPCAIIGGGSCGIIGGGCPMVNGCLAIDPVPFQTVVGTMRQPLYSASSGCATIASFGNFQMGGMFSTSKIPSFNVNGGCPNIDSPNLATIGGMYTNPALTQNVLNFNRMPGFGR
jgi:hypothetical protein